MTRWKRVVFAADCDEDGNCPHCGIDYADCGCPGPTQDGYEYRFVNGIMYGRKRGGDDEKDSRPDPVRAVRARAR